MKSIVPYYFRATLDWIADNNMTPYIVVVHDAEGVVLPPGATGEVTILSISATAVKHFSQENWGLSFQARLWGQECFCEIPWRALVGIYPKENPELVFRMPVETTLEQATTTEQPKAEFADQPPTKPVERKPRTHLRVVK